MSDLRRCDQCQKEIEAVGVGDVYWGHLRFAANNFGTGFEGDFCSWRCIADFAEKRASFRDQLGSTSYVVDGVGCR